MSLGNLGDLDLGQLQKYLLDVSFPAGKEEILSKAESSGASQEVLDRITDAGPDTFNSPEEVLQAVQGKL